MDSNYISLPSEISQSFSSIQFCFVPALLYQNNFLHLYNLRVLRKYRCAHAHIPYIYTHRERTGKTDTKWSKHIILILHMNSKEFRLLS